MTIWHNFALISAFTAIFLAQLIKLPLYYIANRSWSLGICFSTGGMPSSHSAAMASLSTAIGIDQGVDSVSFAISIVLSAIIMFDAAGIRRHAGRQAVVLNRLLGNNKYPAPDTIRLKELLGHHPIEVIAGAAFGTVISLIVYLSCYR